MTTEQETGNRIIAVFMDAEMPSYSKDAAGNITARSLVYKGVRVDYIGDSAYGNFKFHSSWEWQIEAWKKLYKSVIENISEEEKLKAFFVFNERYHQTMNLYSPKETFDILIEAIQWYNLNNKK